VTPHKGRDRRFITAADEVIEQLTICPVALIPTKDKPAKTINQVADRILCHIRSFLVRIFGRLYYYIPDQRHFIGLFCVPGLTR
jgi:hypothetical protein